MDDFSAIAQLLLMEIRSSPDLRTGDASRAESLLSKMESLLAYHGLGFLHGVIPHVSHLAFWKLYQSAGTAGDLLTGKKVLSGAQTICRLLEEESRDYVERFHELCRLIGFELTPEELASELLKFSYLSFASKLVSQFKTSVNVLFADFFGTDRPVVESNDLLYNLFPRRLKVYLKQRVVSLRGRTKLQRKNCEVVYTIFQGLKKGLLPLRPHQVDESLLKHAKALQQSPVVSGEIYDRISALLEEEFPDLPRFVARYERRRDKCLMSTKAVIGGPRSEMGQVGLVTEEISFLSHPVLLGHFRDEGRWAEGLVLVPNERFVDRDLRRKLRIDNWLHKPEVQPQVILEPLKGRIITKPDPGQYIDMNCLQKGLWRYLQKFRQFHLTGRPVSEEDIWHVAQSWDVGRKFVSGDFSAATDNLKGELSDLVLRYALSRVSDQSLVYQSLRSFCHSNVTYKDCFKKRSKQVPAGDRKSQSDYDVRQWRKKESWVDLYPNWECESLGTVRQTNGQLMGHVLSFPVLCIVNYLVFCLVYRDLGRSAPNVLVNGDDILFCATPTEYNLWKERTTECGLIPSMGKNLFSDRIAQINSVLYRVETVQHPTDEFKYYIRAVNEVPYLNFGLLTQRGKGKDETFTMERGASAILGPDDAEPYKMISAAWTVYGDLLRPSFVEESTLLSIYKRHWRREIKELERAGMSVTDRSRVNELRFQKVGAGEPSSWLRDVASVSSYAVGLSSQAGFLPLNQFRRKLRAAGESTPDPNAEVEETPRRRIFRA